jgi:hypothetical protein
MVLFFAYKVNKLNNILISAANALTKLRDAFVVSFLPEKFSAETNNYMDS